MQNEDLVAARMQELKSEFEEVEKKIADKAAEKMTRIILDQLQDVNAEQKLKESIMGLVSLAAVQLKLAQLGLIERKVIQTS